MSSLLLFAVLLTVLLQPATAANPVMDLTPPGSPLDFHMNELIVVCTCGGMPFNFCLCLPPLPNNNAVAPALPEDPVGMPLPEPFEFDIDMEPVLNYVTGDNRPVLNNEYVQYMDANETTVQPITVQAHIEDTYTPGDRSSSHPPRSRKRSQKRQAPRERGFVCNEPGCSDVFNRQCDLNRHRKTSHLDKSERPHVCPTCDKGFLYPKDLRRHRRQHSDPSSVMVTFRCEHPDCSNLDGFSRKDNLQRHQRRQHSSQ